MRSFEVHEPVRVASLAPSGHPIAFLWRGWHHQVRSVEGCGARMRRGRAGPREERRYRLRTEQGLACVLSFDLGRGVWRLERLIATERR